jgi:aminopeptidase N
MRRILVAAAVAALLALAGTPAAAHGRAALAGPGSPGIGDPYYPDYGNGGYDVGHYDIRLRYWPSTDQLTGTTTILATATQDLTSFDLDFVLDVSSVRVNNRPASYARQGDHELVVTPARTLHAGDAMTVVVVYSGIPSSVQAEGFTAWVHLPDGALAEGEPEIAWWWFPSNDHPRDKATFDISVLVPDGTSVLSNGLLTRRAQPELLGWSRWSYREVWPMATYLAFVDIGQYDVHVDTSASGQPIITAYSLALGVAEGNAARADVERTDEVVDWESGLFGPYPFEARGGVVVPSRTLFFALENQTRPVYDGLFWARGDAMYVVVHENAHEWFGDSVSVYNWADIWLNEGFASYAEWLWSQSQGEGTAQELFDFTYAQHPADDPFWQVTIGDPGVAHEFDTPVYDRGAMALHALRLAVGDDAFFTILRTWAAQHAHGNGTVAQFEALAQAISGQDLGALFTAWLFTPSRPDLGASGSPAAAVAPHQPASWTRIQQSHRDVHPRG